MSITTCPPCGREFDDMPLLQAEAQFLVRTQGVGAARARVEEELDEFHANGHRWPG